MGYLDDKVSQAREGAQGFAGAIQGMPAGVGSVPGVHNTPFDVGTWGGAIQDIGGGITGGLGGLAGGLSGLLGNLFGGKGGGGKSSADYGSQMVTPEISAYQGIDTLGGKQLLNAQQVQNSPWINMALEKQAADQNKMYSDAIKQQQSALAQGRTNLAMKGGLSTGAAERMASQGANDLAMTRQSILGQGASDRAGLGMQQAGIETDLNKYNTGLKQQTEQFNVANSIADLQRKNEQERFKYGEQMKLKGAGMSAQAMENAGKK
jgi:hypothetical protein